MATTTCRAAPATKVDPGIVHEASSPQAMVERQGPKLSDPVLSTIVPFSPPATFVQVQAQGIHGAAWQLANGAPEKSLQLLEGDSSAFEEGSQDWFVERAIRGRAEYSLGNFEKAAQALEPMIHHRKLATYLPVEDWLWYEYATILAKWAENGSLTPKEADRKRQEAFALLKKAQKQSPIRNLAAMRVLEAQIAAAMQGKNSRDTKIWALRAEKLLRKVIAQYPNYPKIGELRWLYTQSLLRAGKTTSAISALRELAMERTGEPEAEQAWAALVSLQGKRLRPWSYSEQLERAEAARRLRRVEASRKILDELLQDAKLPTYLRKQALDSRAYTAAKQRDYTTCIADLRLLQKHENTKEVRERLEYCLERGHAYDEALELVLADVSKRGMTGKNALWSGIQLAVRGGKYERAQQLLDRFATSYRSYREHQHWLRAWLHLRLGQSKQAIAEFNELAQKAKRYSTYQPYYDPARYFLGKLYLQSPEQEERNLGIEILRTFTLQQPFRYYGLQARARLLEAGLSVPEPIRIKPMANESSSADYLATRARFQQIVERFGESSPALVRADSLHSIGYYEESKREFRIAVDEFFHASRSMGGGYTPRNEDAIIGLGWKDSWKNPSIRSTRKARQVLREDELSAYVRQEFHNLAFALEEPYRGARLATASDGSLLARWHPRAFRPVIEQHANHWGFSPDHLWALMYTESRFRRHVVSPVGARGALQIMPWTARQLAERLNKLEHGRFDYDQLYNIETNAHFAAYYFSELLLKFHGQPAFAYASYNAGPSNAARWLIAKSQGPRPIELDEWIEEIPYTETKRYTKRVMEVRATYEWLYRGELSLESNKIDPEVEDNIDF